MPTNALENPLVLPLLGLLAERPAHGYALYTGLRDRYRRLRVRRGSVYTLLDRLTEAGWVEAARRPAPSPYVLTPGGAAALADEVDRRIRDAPVGPSDAFTTAVAYLGILPPDRAAALLEERRVRTREEIRRLEQAIAAEPMDELRMLEAHYLVAALRHDATWLGATVRRIRAGDLAWPSSASARDPVGGWGAG